MQQGQQVHQGPQGGQQEQGEHIFWGVYIGLEYPLTEHLQEIDPNSEFFPNVHSYIQAFPFTNEYFNRVYQFYISSRVSDMTVYSI